MVEPKTVLLISADVEALRERADQLHTAGFATKIASDANELQAAITQEDRVRVDVAVVGAALPGRERMRITAILHEVAGRIPIVLVTDAAKGIVDKPDAVVEATASPSEFVTVVTKVSAGSNPIRSQ
jgi:DNA-binding NtrC family response regulator